jgi:YVTN family beta-propeller protein
MRRSLLLAAILAGVTSPAGAAYRAWIPNQNSGDVSVIDIATDTVVATVAVGGRRLRLNGPLSLTQRSSPGTRSSVLPN